MKTKIKKVKIENFSTREFPYSKLVRNSLDFEIETHCLENEKLLQVFFYRDHERTKDFIKANKIKGHLSLQESFLEKELRNLRLWINEDSFMIGEGSLVEISIKEYNFNGNLKDFKKGKVAILMEFRFDEVNPNLSRFCGDLRAFYKEEDIV